MSPAQAIAQGLARAALQETGRAAGGALRGLIPASRGMVPTALVHAPQPLREPHAELARELYQGRFSLAGCKIEPGASSPFHAKDAPARWRRALASFAWLPDLVSGDGELARIQARCLISDWISADRRQRGLGWEPEVVSRRLIAWFSCAPFVLANAGEEYRRGLLLSIGRQIRFLSTAISATSASWPHLHGAIALNYAVVCAEGLERHAERFSDVLNQALEAQLLGDGGHISRNPARCVDILELLLPLKASFEERDVPLPVNLVNAIDRLFPMLRTMLHGDRGLAFFNGCSETRRRLVSSILTLDTRRARPMTVARHSGFARLEQGNAVVIADTGAPASPRASETGHSGALSFELSHGTQRIIVNCGYSGEGPDEWRAATRSTAAHSTLSIADHSSAKVFDNWLTRAVFDGPVTLGPAHVHAEASPSEAGMLLSAEHDGFARSHGLIHQRQIYLAANGEDVRGEDRLVPMQGASGASPPKSYPFCIRFHLHPSIKATPSKDSASVLLMLPDKTGWRFSARGALLKQEESVYFIDRDVPHRTNQIVLFAETSRTPDVKWALKRIGRQADTGKKPQTTMTRLPLKGGRMN